MTIPIWFNDPTILLNNKYITDIWPNSNMTNNEKINAISRIVILLTLLGFLVTKRIKIIVTGVVTLIAIFILYKSLYEKDVLESVKNEGFTNPNTYNKIKNNFQNPTEKNPAMNVLLTQIDDEPNRKAAAPAFNPKVRDKMNNDTKKFVMDNFNNDKDINDKLFKDLGDNFNFEQSMRSWYATPNTNIPNDQNAFAQFCYGDMISCKEGNELACTRNAPPHWING